MKAVDNDIKRKSDELNETKQRHAQYSKKEGQNLFSKDLGDMIYGQVPKELFVETHGTELFASVVVILPK